MAKVYTIQSGKVIPNDFIDIGDRVLIVSEPSDTPELAAILQTHLPAFADLFSRKNAEYGSNADVLGQRGQFADIWRKIGKLKTAMWDGEEDRLTSETTDEILLDLIGHCFLTLEIRSRTKGHGSQAVSIESDFTSEAGNILRSLAISSGDLRITVEDIVEAVHRHRVVSGVIESLERTTGRDGGGEESAYISGSSGEGKLGKRDGF